MVLSWLKKLCHPFGLHNVFINCWITWKMVELKGWHLGVKWFLSNKDNMLDEPIWIVVGFKLTYLLFFHLGYFGKTLKMRKLWDVLFTQQPPVMSRLKFVAVGSSLYSDKWLLLIYLLETHCYTTQAALMCTFIYLLWIRFCKTTYQLPVVKRSCRVIGLS